MKRWRNFILVVICAAFAFGGTFTCKGSHGSVHHDDEHRNN